MSLFDNVRSNEGSWRIILPGHIKIPTFNVRQIELKNKLTSALANLLLMIVVTGAFLLALEGLSRLVSAEVKKEINFFKLSTSPYYRSDETLGWRPRENVKGEHNQEGSFTTTFRTNSRGLRDREYSIEKPNGVTRIVV